MNTTDIDQYQFKNMLMDMTQLGAAMAVKAISPSGDEMSQREAWNTFGRQRIALWNKLGYINTKQRYGAGNNSKICYSRSELMALDKKNGYSSQTSSDILREAFMDLVECTIVCTAAGKICVFNHLF